MNQPLVSIIMPVFNGASFLAQAIQSVLNQTYTKWELLVINDGSTDDSQHIIHSFPDERIRYFSQDNKGVSAARNVGLAEMKGQYFCFLDADDVLPPDSVAVRIKHFEKNPGIGFVDGAVRITSEDLKNTLRFYKPSFRGNPHRELMKLNGTCFVGPSWMVKKTADQYQMDEALRHGEDLMFYIAISYQGGIYDYVDQEILLYRQHSSSAMRNLEGLHKGYRVMYEKLKAFPGFSGWIRFRYQLRVKRFMALSYVADKNYRAAFLTLIS
ncbi:MAG TPA: glycosyltransferase family 2 protein [Chryseosolibacter sp.]